MITIALPKGRLGDKVYNLFASIGYDCSEIYDDNRKLVSKTKKTVYAIFWLSPPMWRFMFITAPPIWV